MQRRIAIIGNCAGGKSTLAKALSQTLSVEVFHLDLLQWGESWTKVPETHFEAAHEEIIREDNWIIDGLGTWSSIERRFIAAKTIVFVDHPFKIHLWWAAKRQVQCLFSQREDLPVNCSMIRASGMIFKTMLAMQSQGRQHLLELIAKHRETKEVIHIISPTQLRDLLKSGFSG